MLSSCCGYVHLDHEIEGPFQLGKMFPYPKGESLLQSILCRDLKNARSVTHEGSPTNAEGHLGQAKPEEVNPPDTNHTAKVHQPKQPAGPGEVTAQHLQTPSPCDETMSSGPTPAQPKCLTACKVSVSRTQAHSHQELRRPVLLVGHSSFLS